MLIHVAVGAADSDTWYADADRRIAEHRMGELVVTFVDEDRNPIANAEVHVQQRRHAFGFGTALSARHLAKTEADDPYRQHMRELFNCVVIENGQKWPLWERSDWRGITEEAVDWAFRQGLGVRGHVMVWQTTQFGKPMPKDVWSQVLAAQDGQPADLDHVRRRIDQHIRTIGHHFRDRVVHWDVTNEITDHHKALEVLTPDEPAHRSSLIADWYRLAHEVDPEAKLFVNDYHILVGDKKNFKNRYEETIESLVQAGAPLHGIGMQCHYYHKNLTRTPQQIHDTLDRFGRFGLPIWISEFDTFGHGWGEGAERDQAQADFFRQHLYACFAHPAVEGHVMWGFWDGSHWAKQAPLFAKDWSPKPGYEVYRELVLGRWWTDETATTDEQGVLRLPVFKGQHSVSLTHQGKRYELPVTVLEDEAHHRLRIKD
jgi:endo-1,4-beta-xylanase